MLWLNIRRIFRSGLTNVLRNTFVSLASLFVMTMTVVIIGSLMFLSGLIGQFVEYVRDKVDVNVYFVTSADEAAILDLKVELEQLPEVKFVEYTDRETALNNFRARHQDDQLTVQALDELGENPFGASLSIKAKEPSQYEGVARYLNERVDQSGLPLIDTVNYAKNKAVIDQLNTVTVSVQRVGYVISLIFALASVLITFNTIRLAIYTAREEISVMRLVGASNWYIRGPFVVEGTVYGALSGLIAILAFFPITFFLRDATLATFATNIFSYYLSNFVLFFGVLVLAGALLGALSALLAVRKYLSV